MTDYVSFSKHNVLRVPAGAFSRRRVAPVRQFRRNTLLWYGIKREGLVDLFFFVRDEALPKLLQSSLIFFFLKTFFYKVMEHSPVPNHPDKLFWQEGTCPNLVRRAFGQAYYAPVRRSFFAKEDRRGV